LPRNILILGCGPAGLACAHQLLSRGGDDQVVVVDKASAVGGFGASFPWRGHTLDIGPHAFHARGERPDKLVRSIFDENPGDLITGRKNVSVYLYGKRFRYPLQVGEALLKFNPFLSARIIVSFALTSIFHSIVSIPVTSFEDWGHKRFGWTLYKISFGDYTEKVWKTKPGKISEKFASEKIQGFSLINLLRRLFKIGGQVTEPYYQEWIYHRNGSGALFSLLASKIRALGGDIRLETEAVHCTLDKNRHVSSVTVRQNGREESLPCDLLINTIPLRDFVTMFGRALPFSVRHAAEKLQYISLILVMVEINLDRAIDGHWFYLLEPHFRFNRVTEQKNLSADTIEPGKTVLSLELTCREGDATWALTEEQLFEMARDDLSKVNFLSQAVERISGCVVKRFPRAYELYYTHFDEHAGMAIDFCRDLGNVATIGRRGLFLQGDMHKSMEMGINCADIIGEAGIDRHSLDDFYRKYVRYIDDL
jgi:protoporphyrinogen oxidase